jgi:hypothetical protein
LGADGQKAPATERRNQTGKGRWEIKGMLLPVIPAFGRLRQEDCKFKVRLCNGAKFHLLEDEGAGAFIHPGPLL